MSALPKRKFRLDGEDTCDCLFCQHNKANECGCQPCQWLRSQYSVRQLKEAGHTFWTGEE